MKTILEKIRHLFDFQVNKHGNYCGFTDFDTWINQLTNMEMLEEISIAIGQIE